MKPILTLTSLATVALLSIACSGSMVHKKPESPEVNRAVTSMWAQDIKRVARDGDWILTRSYSAIGDMITFGTSGPGISHASVYDAERGTAIEAVRPVVHEVPLEELLERNRIAIIVRPHGLSDAEGRASLLRARSALGRPFDLGGMFGIDDENEFYCSELVVWAAGIDTGDLVVTPASLLEHGEVIYLSGSRESADLQRIAVAKQRRGRLRVAARGR